MVIFIGSNPSRQNDSTKLPFKGTQSGKRLEEWIEFLEVGTCGMANVSETITPKNRAIKVSEFELEKLEKALQGFEVVIALGNTASKALNKLEVKHFKLPHPSPRNRVLNNKEFIKRQLKECKKYINRLKRT
jgi:uracil-DNA glycosylase